MNILKNAALDYAELGFSVFPCRPNGKKPLTEHGCKDATTDSVIIEQWWVKWPAANIGLATIGLVVVDIDSINGKANTWNDTPEIFDSLMVAPGQTTPNDGQHRFFKQPSGKPYRNTASKIAPNVDTRSDGGYVIAAPSQLDGRAYKWFEPLDCSPGELPIFPEVLQRLFHKENGNHKNPTSASNVINDGQRNDNLFRIASAMRGNGNNEQEILAELKTVNTTRCKPPLETNDLIKIAKSVAERYESNASSKAAPWPDPLGDAALSGLAGDLVRLIEPHSESDPAALLLQFLVAFGNMTGRNAYYRVEGDKHYGNLFTVMVGETAKGRKGTSWGQIRRMLKMVDEDWCSDNTPSGLSSGEGLIWAVRDKIIKKVPIRIGNKKTGTITGYEDEIDDHGIEDKRLLVVEGEFSNVLKVSGREKNTLSAIIRSAWDSGNLQTLTKTSPAKATDAHISLIGHITRAELLILLSECDMLNGVGNRILWVCVKRSKMLPDGGSLQTQDLEPLAEKIRTSIEFAQQCTRIERDDEARELWHEVYPELSDGKHGLFGAVISRSEAQVTRLSILYALLDQSQFVRKHHLQAALAVWKYCEQSAAYIFGGEEKATPSEQESLIEWIECKGGKVTVRELQTRWPSKYKKSDDAESALNKLRDDGLGTWLPPENTGQRGRPKQYFQIGKAATKLQ